MEYVKSFHYIDDFRYTENYISLKSGRKSKKELQLELKRKGISDEIFSQVWNQCGFQEQDAIKQLIKKRHVDVVKGNCEEMQKLYGYLMRKGFSYDEIKTAVRAVQEEN